MSPALLTAKTGLGAFSVAKASVAKRFGREQASNRVPNRINFHLRKRTLDLHSMCLEHLTRETRYRRRLQKMLDLGNVRCRALYRAGRTETRCEKGAEIFRKFKTKLTRVDDRR